MKMSSSFSLLSLLLLLIWLTVVSGFVTTTTTTTTTTSLAIGTRKNRLSTFISKFNRLDQTISCCWKLQNHDSKTKMRAASASASAASAAAGLLLSHSVSSSCNDFLLTNSLETTTTSTAAAMSLLLPPIKVGATAVTAATSASTGILSSTITTDIIMISEQSSSLSSLLLLSQQQQQQQELSVLTILLAFWVIAFSIFHIGLSAIRETLIGYIGTTIADETLGIVNNPKFTNILPNYWPGDSVGKNSLFPTADIAGRQLYRLGYTLVSFVTLGNAILTYQSIQQLRQQMQYQQQYNYDSASSWFLTEMASTTAPAAATATTATSAIISATTMLFPEHNNVFFMIASASFAASIASLFNASPLGLMPSFETPPPPPPPSSSLFISNKQPKSQQQQQQFIQRNDDLKLQPKGLTRITRHPLILPVVPWGIATSYLAGGHSEDWILFTGLSIYAIVGCACQDLRVLRQEGSVGTVMNVVGKEKSNKYNNDNNNKTKSKNTSSTTSISTAATTTTTAASSPLLEFFEMTSFVPFMAVLDGRQSLKLILREAPILAFLIGYPIGEYFETILLKWLLVIPQ